PQTPKPPPRRPASSAPRPHAYPPPCPFPPLLEGRRRHSFAGRRTPPSQPYHPARPGCSGVGRSVRRGGCASCGGWSRGRRCLTGRRVARTALAPRPFHIFRTPPFGKRFRLVREDFA